MSKKLIAGAGVVASFAIALAPLATFAQSGDSTIGADNFEITINESCTFTIAGLADGYNEEDPDATPDPVSYSPFSNTYTRTLTAGQSVEIAGGNTDGAQQSPTPTTVTVICNHNADTEGTDGHGYYIQAAATPLYIQVEDTQNSGQTTDGTENIPLRDPGDGISGWGVELSATNTKGADTNDVQGDMTIVNGYSDSSYKALPASATTIASGNISRNAGDVFTILGYKVSTSRSQKAGIYKGHVTYTFVAPVTDND